MIRFLVLVLLVTSGAYHITLNGSIAATSQDQVPKKGLEFRYIIIRNEVFNPNKPKSARREITVLMEEKAFSEDNLKKLYYLISNRFSNPQWMFISVYTSLEQLKTPEEEELPVMSDSRRAPELEQLLAKLNSAVLIRENGNELIRYSVSPPDTTRKTVVLKGKDPYGPQK